LWYPPPLLISTKPPCRCPSSGGLDTVTVMPVPVPALLRIPITVRPLEASRLKRGNEK
jgi:hypothetical protein